MLSRREVCSVEGPLILVKNASSYRIIYENGQEEAAEAENVQKSVEPGEISSFI